MDSTLIVNAVGTLAGLCSMTSFVPQIVKIWREKKAEGVSLRMFSVTVTAFVLWTAYGVLLQSWPIAVSNAIASSYPAPSSRCGFILEMVRHPTLEPRSARPQKSDTVLMASGHETTQYLVTRRLGPLTPQRGFKDFALRAPG